MYVCVDVVCPYESRASGLHSRFTHCKGKMLGIFCEKKVGHEDDKGEHHSSHELRLDEVS